MEIFYVTLEDQIRSSGLVQRTFNFNHWVKWEFTFNIIKDDRKCPSENFLSLSMLQRFLTLKHFIPGHWSISPLPLTSTISALSLPKVINLTFMKVTGEILSKKNLFLTIFLLTDWEDLSKIDKLNVDNSTQMYFDKINTLLETYASLKRIHKSKWNFKSKPRITLGLKNQYL